MFIINARIFTMEAEGIIENGFIEIKDDKIIYVGRMEELNIADIGKAYDACGKNVLPGFIDAHCHIGMWEDSLGFEGDDGNEDTDPITPQLRAVDAVNPTDRCFEDAYMAGITSVVTGPGSANPIGGQLAALKTYGKRIDNNIIKAPVGIKTALGENPKSVYNAKHQMPVTRMATAALIRENLRKAERYMKDSDEAKNDPELEQPELDVKYEALVPVLKGEVPLHIHAHRADDIFTAVRISKEFNIRYVLVHCTDGHLIADELSAEKVTALCGPSLSDRSKPELKNQTFKTPGELDRHGIMTAIITDHPVIPIQYLPLCAALAHKAGKDADIIIYDGDPLDYIKSDCVFVMISGKRVK